MSNQKFEVKPYRGSFLSEIIGENRKGEGGLRTCGYFKKSTCQKPLITVVTVVLNGEAYIEKTLLSVLNQTYDNIEYIVLDGGSSDRTIEIIRKYDNAIDYWVSEKDNGIYYAMNKGIDLATGEWINFLNGGDCFFNNDVLQHVFIKNSFSDACILYGNHQVAYPSGKKKSRVAGHIKNLWRGSQFCHQASFVKSQYHKLNVFNPRLSMAADFEFFYKAWKSGVLFHHLDVVIVKFQSGGISDIKRIDSILEWWITVDKNFRNNIFYCFLSLKESIKSTGVCKYILDKFR